MVALLAALQFLTVFPPVIRRRFTSKEMGLSLSLYPIVGLILGSILLGLEFSLRLVFPESIVGVLVLSSWLAFTRSLHFDGFLDTCDGLFGGFTPERRMEIMRDPHVGAFGVAGGVLLILVKYLAIASLTNRLAGLLLAPVLGRWVLAIAVFIYPYGREVGLGREMKDNTKWSHALLATATALVTTWFIGGFKGLIAWFITGIILFSGAAYTLKRLSGLTGDIYGALCEIAEVVVLLVFVTGPL